MWSVYIHTTPSNKKYVGITSYNVTSRWGTNGEGYKGQLFWRAICKYGWQNIEHQVVLETDSKSVAEELEIQLIKDLRTQDRNFGYNIASGGYVNSGYHITITPETRKKIGDALRGRKLSVNQRIAIGNFHRGKIVSIKTREKIREAALNMSQDTKSKISNSVKQRWEDGSYDNRSGTGWSKGLTAETDLRIAKMGRRKPGEFHHTVESREKLSLAHKGKPAHNRIQVMCVETGIVYESIAAASKETGIQNISSVVDKLDRTAGKCHWRRYIDEQENNNS